MITGQVGLILDGTSFWPRVIERVTGSRAHHVVVAVSETHCVGAEPGGARLRPISEFECPTVWSQFDLTPLQQWKVQYHAMNSVGLAYGYAAFVAIGAAYLTRHRTARLDWLTPRLRGAECAQLADAVLTAAGVEVFTDGREPGIVHPGSFERLFQTRGWLPAPAREPAGTNRSMR